MTTTRLQRYDFGSLRDFRGPIITPMIEDVIEEAPPPPPPPTFSEEDLNASCEAAKKLGYAEGFEAGLARAAEQADSKRESAEGAMRQMGQVLAQVEQAYQHLLTRESGELTQLVLMIARKVAGEALDARQDAPITALIERCLPVIFSKPRLIVELHPDTLEAALDRIETLLHSQGFEGEVTFQTNPALGPHDTVLDWGSGEARRSADVLWQEIESLLAAMPVTIAPFASLQASGHMPSTT